GAKAFQAQNVTRQQRPQLVGAGTSIRPRATLGGAGTANLTHAPRAASLKNRRQRTPHSFRSATAVHTHRSAWLTREPQRRRILVALSVIRRAIVNLIAI